MVLHEEKRMSLCGHFARRLGGGSKIKFKIFFFFSGNDYVPVRATYVLEEVLKNA